MPDAAQQAAGTMSTSSSAAAGATSSSRCSSSSSSSGFLITCDQVVVHEGAIREKPEDIEEAHRCGCDVCDVWVGGWMLGAACLAGCRCPRLSLAGGPPPPLPPPWYN